MDDLARVRDGCVESYVVQSGGPGAYSAKSPALVLSLIEDASEDGNDKAPIERRQSG